MTRLLTLLVVLCLVVPATVVDVAAQSDESQTAVASITDVTVSPTQPIVGERFTVTTTIRNAAASQSSLTINEVTLERISGNDVADVRNLGSLAPGGELRIPLTSEFAEVGVKRLRVVVDAESNGEDIELRYPLTVTVREGGPQVSISVDDAVVGTETTATVVVANGEDATARNVRLSLAGENVAVDDGDRVAPQIPSGETREFAFTVRPATTEGAVTATLRYTTAAGDTVTVDERLSLAADPLREDVGLAANVVEGGVEPPVLVDVTNFGNAPLSRVVLSAVADGTVVTRRAVDPIPAESSRSVRFNVSNVPEGDLTVRVDYETGASEGRVETTVPYRTNPGRIELTGVDYEREGDRLYITGSASNVGLSDVDSVIVSVVPGAGVQPARPYREYFVGTVPASDFVSFDLYAAVDANATAIPIRIEYLSDGIEQTSVYEVPIDDRQPTSGPSPATNGPSPLVFFGGGLVVLAVLATGGFLYLRR
ncbi:hypothetical protein SAMN04487949_1245 [Halogranum gelatinilyticum]|uniref:CARDB protein n=1 Tax=Halogranum gelatinilyticum TaxID=660521 RepID=A0A1G9R9L6_9EURY|nr:hypothetical protein [Halogranum gelatinilyticum]SDM19918.1 hypothetical protein SAMN04487949_1245 [Halogranum gelatinilyticum]